LKLKRRGKTLRRLRRRRQRQRQLLLPHPSEAGRCQGCACRQKARGYPGSASLREAIRLEMSSPLTPPRRPRRRRTVRRWLPPPTLVSLAAVAAVGSPTGASRTRVVPAVHAQAAPRRLPCKASALRARSPQGVGVPPGALREGRHASSHPRSWRRPRSCRRPRGCRRRREGVHVVSRGAPIGAAWAHDGATLAFSCENTRASRSSRTDGLGTRVASVCAEGRTSELARWGIAPRFRDEC